MDRCDECGFVFDDVSMPDAVARLRGFGARYREALTMADPASLRAHPVEGVWSALEYACHVRDVFTVQRERIDLALIEDTPDFVPMRREERVVENRYNEQQPAAVVDELSSRASALADRVAALTPGELARTGIYNYPQPAQRTLTWVVRNTVHEGEHHLLDIGGAIEQARSSNG